MEKINLNKTVYAKNQYERVIDTKFSQLGTTLTQQEAIQQVEESTISIEQFFTYYNQLFFQIPKEGENNSHEFLIKTSSEYIGFNPLDDEIQALIDEINTLQQTNLELNEKIVELTENSTSTEQE